MAMLDRYCAGECEAVWRELVSTGAAVRSEPAWSEARDVVRETMARVRRNVERIVSKLDALKYEFSLPSYFKSPTIAPDPSAATRIAGAEELVGGPLPLSLATFHEQVGAVCLAGTHPGWRSEYVDTDAPGCVRLLAYKDPLWIDPLNLDHWTEELGDSQGDASGEEFRLPIAPDELHKEDISGGTPYSMTLPDPAADGLLHDEWHRTTFVDYLRRCFEWGGFPGYERFPEALRPSRDLARLCAGLEPI
jgi:hypothetical protein